MANDEPLRPFEETHTHLKNFVEFLDDFNKETERGAVLSATAYIDRLLERTLAAFLIPNDSGFNLTNGFNAVRSTNFVTGAPDGITPSVGFLNLSNRHAIRTHASGEGYW